MEYFLERKQETKSSRNHRLILHFTSRVEWLTRRASSAARPPLAATSNSAATRPLCRPHLTLTALTCVARCLPLTTAWPWPCLQIRLNHQNCTHTTCFWPPTIACLEMLTASTLRWEKNLLIVFYTFLMFRQLLTDTNKHWFFSATFLTVSLRWFSTWAVWNSIECRNGSATTWSDARCSSKEVLHRPTIFLTHTLSH